MKSPSYEFMPRDSFLIKKDTLNIGNPQHMTIIVHRITVISHYNHQPGHHMTRLNFRTFVAVVKQTSYSLKNVMFFKVTLIMQMHST